MMKQGWAPTFTEATSLKTTNQADNTMLQYINKKHKNIK